MGKELLDAVMTIEDLASLDVVHELAAAIVQQEEVAL
jgi:hypothetical protein